MQIGIDYFASVTLPLLQLQDSFDCEEAIWSSRRVKWALILVQESVAGWVSTEVSKGGPGEGESAKKETCTKMTGELTLGCCVKTRT